MTQKCLVRVFFIVWFDQIDLRIFQEFWGLEKNQVISTTTIAKNIFKINDYYELKKKDSFIRKRLNKWVEEGVITIKKNNGKCYYSISEGTVLVGKKVFEVLNDKKLNLNLNNFVSIKNKENIIIFGIIPI